MEAFQKQNSYHYGNPKLETDLKIENGMFSHLTWIQEVTFIQ